MMRFHRMILYSLAGLAALLCFSTPSFAIEYERGAPMVIERMDPVDLLTSVAFIVTEDAVIREQAPAVPVAAQRSIGELAPEYAESYETHGQNFIEVRRRC